MQQESNEFVDHMNGLFRSSVCRFPIDSNIISVDCEDGFVSDDQQPTIAFVVRISVQKSVEQNFLKITLCFCNNLTFYMNVITLNLSYNWWSRKTGWRIEKKTLIW